jgi:hypothetical protein
VGEAENDGNFIVMMRSVVGENENTGSFSAS